MNFRRGIAREDPEINLVPLIDVLLVILIFLMVTTTYSKYAELQIDLPSAEGAIAKDRSQQVDVAVTTSGRYVINRTPVMFTSPEVQLSARQPVVPISDTRSMMAAIRRDYLAEDRIDQATVDQVIKLLYQ
jgi:biopolymer transport protein ExbD